MLKSNHELTLMLLWFVKNFTKRFDSKNSFWLLVTIRNMFMYIIIYEKTFAVEVIIKKKYRYIFFIFIMLFSSSAQIFAQVLAKQNPLSFHRLKYDMIL